MSASPASFADILRRLQANDEALTTVTTGNLSGNAGRRLSQALEDNTMLTSLCIRGKDFALSAIIDVLKDNTTIMDLKVQSDLSKDVGHRLIDLLKINRSLSSLCVGSHDIEVFYVFVDALKKNQTLASFTWTCSFDLQKNDPLAIAALTDMLSVNSSLRSFILSSSSYISFIDSIENIENIFETNHRLTTFMVHADRLQERVASYDRRLELTQLREAGISGRKFRNNISRLQILRIDFAEYTANKTLLGYISRNRELAELSMHLAPLAKNDVNATMIRFAAFSCLKQPALGPSLGNNGGKELLGPCPQTQVSPLSHEQVVIEEVEHPEPAAVFDEDVAMLTVQTQSDEDFARLAEEHLKDSVEEQNHFSNKVHCLSFRSGKGELFRDMILHGDEFKPIRRSLEDHGYPVVMRPSGVVVIVRPEQYLDTIDSLSSFTLKRYMIVIAEPFEYLMSKVRESMPSKQRPRENTGERVPLVLGVKYVSERTFICETPKLLMPGTVVQSTTEAVRSSSSASANYFTHARGENPRRHVLGTNF